MTGWASGRNWLELAGGWTVTRVPHTLTDTLATSVEAGRDQRQGARTRANLARYALIMLPSWSTHVP